MSQPLNRRPIPAIPNRRVAALQSILRRFGFYKNKPTGILDPSTRQGIAAFQQRIGIPTTGEVNKPTIDAIRAVFVQINPSLPNTSITEVPGATVYSDGVFSEFASVLEPDLPGFQSDFERLIERRNDAAVEAIARTGQFDDLGTEALAREAERQERNDACPAVRTTPFSAFTGNYGNMYPVTSGGQSKKCAEWEGDSVEATAVTIALINGGATDAAGATQSYRPYAIINFGNGGAAAQVTVDIGAGVQLCLSASAVDVAVGMDAAPSGQTAGNMNLGAALSFQSANKAAPVTRTCYFDSLGSGLMTNFLRPNFATQILRVGRADVTAAMTLDFLDRAGNQIDTQTVAANQQLTSPIVLADDVYSVNVTNGGAATSGRLVFGLSL